MNTTINFEDFPDDGDYGDTTPAQYEFVIASLTQRYKRLWMYVQMQRNLATSALDTMFMVRAIVNQINPDKYYIESEINQGNYKHNYNLIVFYFSLFILLNFILPFLISRF